MRTDITQTDVGSLNAIKDFAMTPQVLDSPSDQKENYYYDSDFSEYLGYYRTTQLKAPIDTLAIWTIGKGYSVETNRNKVILDKITGWGTDDFIDILYNHFVITKISKIGGMAQIIKNKKGTLINLKMLNPLTMRTVTNAQGNIIAYDKLTSSGGVGKVEKRFKPEEIFHRVNDRLGDENHGTSVVESVKWIIDAKQEAMKDWRRISHRSTVRILYIEEDDKTRMTALKSDYAEAIKKGDLLILPVKAGDAAFADLTLPPVQQFLDWIRYLENLFYQAVRVPKIIATSEGFTEAGGKMGYMTFEPIYTYEQTKLENDIWNQLGIKLTFNKPPSLSNAMNDTEQKNAGQTGIQENDVTAGVGE